MSITIGGMNLSFSKYQGTGNDFILIDNRSLTFPGDDRALVARLCNRHLGIGADGLILLEPDTECDFSMVYYNADGGEGSLCGNGGRCIVAFARDLGIISSSAVFSASDGKHEATVENGNIRLKMNDVSTIDEKPNHLFLDTGSPHHVQIVKDLDNMEVVTDGRRIRYGLYGEKGSNINFVELKGNDIFSVRTYERGVENETLSCGTGVTAVALAMHYLGHTIQEQVRIHTKGGTLEISFQAGEKGYNEIYLSGPAEIVYKGEVAC